MKLTALDSTLYFGFKHQVLDIGTRDDDPLVASQAVSLADREKPFNFLIDSADRLNPAVLIDRAGHGDVLANRQTRQAGEQGVEFCA